MRETHTIELAAPKASERMVLLDHERLTMTTSDVARENANHDGRAPLISRTRELMARHPAMRAWALPILIVLLLLIALSWRYLAVRESTDNAQIDGHIVPIAARIGGTVLSVNVADNQQVKAGTVLLQIDARDYQVALLRARADLADSRATLAAAETGVPIVSTTTKNQTSSAGASVDRAQAGLAGAEARMNSAQAKLREAGANETRARRDLERAKLLVAKEEISQQQYDYALASATAARASLDVAHAGVAEAKQGWQNAAAIVAQARAELESSHTGPQQVAVSRSRAESALARYELASAAVQQATLNLEYATVKAPVSGVVSKKSVEQGQVVQPGQPLLAVVPLDDIWVTANFKETQLKRMRSGQPVTVRVDAYDRSYRGRVESIAAATGARFSLLPPENATGNYVKVVQRVPVKIVFDKGQDPGHLLRPGMSVVPTVLTK